MTPFYIKEFFPKNFILHIGNNLKQGVVFLYTWGNFSKNFHKHFFIRIFHLRDYPPFLTPKNTYMEGGYGGGEGYPPHIGGYGGYIPI